VIFKINTKPCCIICLEPYEGLQGSETLKRKSKIDYVVCAELWKDMEGRVTFPLNT
jgi:hypothetical protein